MWILQYCINEYNQEGYYSIKAWIDKPNLVQLAGRPLEGLNEDEIIRVVSLFKGEEFKDERLIQTLADGSIPY